MSTPFPPRTKDDVLVTLNVDNPLFSFAYPERLIRLHPGSPSFMIGRTSRRDNSLLASSANAWFDSPVMSRNHAEIFVDFEKKQLFIKDPKSLHGTYVNDIQVGREESRLLLNNDRLSFGISITRGADVFNPCAMSLSIEFGADSLRPSVFRVPDTDVEDDDDASSGCESLEEASLLIDQKGYRPLVKAKAAAQTSEITNNRIAPRTTIDLTTMDERFDHKRVVDLTDETDPSAGVFITKKSSSKERVVTKQVQLTTEEEMTETPHLSPGETKEVADERLLSLNDADDGASTDQSMSGAGEPTGFSDYQMDSDEDGKSPFYGVFDDMSVNESGDDDISFDGDSNQAELSEDEDMDMDMTCKAPSHWTQTVSRKINYGSTHEASANTSSDPYDEYFDDVGGVIAEGEHGSEDLHPSMNKPAQRIRSGCEAASADRIEEPGNESHSRPLLPPISSLDFPQQRSASPGRICSYDMAFDQHAHHHLPSPQMMTQDASVPYAVHAPQATTYAARERSPVTNTRAWNEPGENSMDSSRLSPVKAVETDRDQGVELDVGSAHACEEGRKSADRRRTRVDIKYLIHKKMRPSYKLLGEGLTSDNNSAEKALPLLETGAAAMESDYNFKVLAALERVSAKKGFGEETARDRDFARNHSLNTKSPKRLSGIFVDDSSDELSDLFCKSSGSVTEEMSSAEKMNFPREKEIMGSYSTRMTKLTKQNMVGTPRPGKNAEQAPGNVFEKIIQDAEVSVVDPIIQEDSRPALGAPSKKRKADEISSATKEELNAMPSPPPEPTPQSAPDVTEITATESGMEPRRTKRARRIVEAVGFAVFGGVALFSTLVATAPSL